MNEAAVEAVWADANINATQQHIVKRHLWYYFDKHIFIAENKIASESDYYSVPTYYGEYKHYKDMVTNLRKLINAPSGFIILLEYWKKN